MRRYVVLWIPTLVETPPAILADPEPIELRDVPSLPACTLRADVNRQSKNIKIYYRLDDRVQENLLEFSYLESNKYGFIIYEVDDRGAKNALTQALQTTLHYSIYHYIKGIFHQHNSHGAECDSLLSAFCESQLVRWSDRNVPRRVFTHYLNEYSKKLEGYYLTLSSQFNFLKELVNVRKQYKIGVEKSLVLKKECTRIMGEVAYASFLLRVARSSINNSDYSRLYNAIVRLERLSNHCSDAYNTINNTYNNRLGLLGVWLGALGIILTAALEIIHSCSKDGEKRNEALLLKLTEQHDRKVEELIQRADSLSNENIRVLNLLNPQ